MTGIFSLINFTVFSKCYLMSPYRFVERGNVQSSLRVTLLFQKALSMVLSGPPRPSSLCFDV